MTLSKQAQENKPKKPLNAYFKFRTDKLKEFKDEPDRVDKAKQLWQTIAEKDKKKMEDEFHSQLDQYKKDIEAWKKKYNVSEEDAKRKSKKKQTTDDEEKKPTKTKGTKEAKQGEKKREDSKKKDEGKKSAQKKKQMSKPKMGGGKKRC